MTQRQKWTKLAREKGCGPHVDRVLNLMEVAFAEGRNQEHALLRRMTDLVRHQRGTLFSEGLITPEEYAEVAFSYGSVARLETYDGVIQRLDEVEAQLAAATQQIEQEQSVAVELQKRLDAAEAKLRALGCAGDVFPFRKDADPLTREDVIRMIEDERVATAKAAQVEAEAEAERVSRLETQKCLRGLR